MQLSKKTTTLMVLATTAGSGVVQGVSPLVQANDNTKNAEEKSVTVPQIDYSDVDKEISAAKKQGMKITDSTKTVEVNSVQEANKMIESLKPTTDKNKTDLMKKIAAFNEWNGQNTGMEGVSPQEFNQQLDLKSEPNATTTVKSLSDKVDIKKYAQKDWPGEKGSMDVKEYWKSDSAYVVKAKEGGLLNVKGDIVEVTYDNLEHSTYKGKKITKIVKVLSDANSNTSWVDDSSLWIAQNPSEAFYLRGGVNSVSRTFTKMYDENGKEITLGDDALITYGSLNSKNQDKDGNNVRKGTPYHREQVSSPNELFKLEGSSISVHGKTAYSDFDNEPDRDWTPKKFKEWDSPSSDTRVYGSVIGKLKLGQKDTFSIYRSDDATNRYGTMWVSESTTLPPATPAPSGKFERTEIKLIPGETTPIKKSVVTENWLKAIESTKQIDGEVSLENEAPAVQLGEQFGYVKHTKIDVSNEEGQETEKFELHDVLDSVLTLDSVQVIDLTDEKNVTDDFEIDGNISVKLKSDKMKDYLGHEIEWRVGVHIDPTADLSALKQEDGKYIVKNVAQKIQNENTVGSNEIVVEVTPPEEPKKETPEKELPEVGKPLEEAPNTGVTNPLTQFVQWVKNFF